MKNKIFIAVLCLCAVCITLFSAGCSNSGELEKQIADLQQQVEQLTEENEGLSNDKGGLESQLAALQKEFETLKSENSLTEEQLADLQFKFEKLMKVDWLFDQPRYGLDSVRVYVKKEFSDKEYKPEDFLPVKVEKITRHEYNHILDVDFYNLELSDCGLKYVANALIQLYSLDFVAWADLDYHAQGA